MIDTNQRCFPISIYATVPVTTIIINAHFKWKLILKYQSLKESQEINDLAISQYIKYYKKHMNLVNKIQDLIEYYSNYGHNSKQVKVNIANIATITTDQRYTRLYEVSEQTIFFAHSSSASSHFPIFILHTLLWN